MTPLDKLTEAMGSRAVTVHKERCGCGHGPTDADYIAAIQAALPEGHYLGREGVVRATEMAGHCTVHGDLGEWDGGLWSCYSYDGEDECLPKALFVIEPWTVVALPEESER